MYEQADHRQGTDVLRPITILLHMQASHIGNTDVLQHIASPVCSPMRIVSTMVFFVGLKTFAK